MSQVPQQRFGCYIGNIDRSVTLDVLRQVFSQCGVIIDCSLNGRDEDPYRYGFIDFASEEDRGRAMKYNGFTLAGRKIKVGVSKGNVGRPEGFNNTNGSSNNGPNSSSTNTNQQQQQQQQVQQPQQPQIPSVALAATLLPSVIQQQQQGTQLLMQLIQQGAIDINNLTPEQQQILMTSLLPQAAPPTPGIPAMPPMAPMGYPPMQQAWGGHRGGGGVGGVGVAGVGAYAGGPPVNRGMPYSRGPANPMPSEETVKLREVQRKQFLDVVRRDAEKYEKKLRERGAKEGKTGSVSGSEDSSDDDEAGERRRRGHGKRGEDETEGEKNKRARHHDDGGRHHHHNHHHVNSSKEHATDAGDSNADNKADDKKELEHTEVVEEPKGTEEHNEVEEVKVAEPEEEKDDREEI
ncbi:RNA-binding protein [Trypanosoma rangeli]|uniref:RNA-binding protein n=1 Tax=Trypanosoma rangeli TaxID=5698 RepID=A0A3R7NQ72_TRYRA|nr:RNA-binding protein [Trypanosoma rangeli]RNF09857.1 RNA-binding protein [Trypanosoma rangeli]|eukprot:RNF09857.1 RNA-binding protein [Trypanosoma rangeli]